MTVYVAAGDRRASLTDDDLRAGLGDALSQLGPRRRVLAVPPDFSRYRSRAGMLTCAVFAHYGRCLTDVMPALGTHRPMSDQQLKAMFPSLRRDLFRVHQWRRDVVTLGEVPGDFVADVTDGIRTRPWPAQLNQLVCQGGHDLILSLGQVVPHEVIGMANYNKNLFVGTGGEAGINESHYLSAVYGMERIIGRADTPLRRILNEAQKRFCRQLPLVFVLTVVAPDEQGQLCTRGLFIGDDVECFEAAAALSRQVNCFELAQPAGKIVAYLDPDEYHSTWLGNKAIYRTRRALAEGGELLVLAPGVRCFGEDDRIDRLIRKYGYRPAAEVMRLVDGNADLRENLAAAAHLIHGSHEGRFRVTYCPGALSRKEITAVGYDYADVSEMLRKYPVAELLDGWNVAADGARFYFVRNPGLGLWMAREACS